MDRIRLIDVKETILSDNQALAQEIRDQLQSKKVFMLNVMSSPGAGKTSLILETIRRMKKDFRIGVIEADIESVVDAEKVAAEGVPAVQLHTGGACHIDAPMVRVALDTMDLELLDFIIIENVGNLVCPAEFDTGAVKKTMILSVPEGDDKALKYPLMFSVCDALVVSKIDYLPYSNFDITAMRERVLCLNSRIQIFETSCRTGERLDDWCNYLRKEILVFRDGN